jgi:uncharacterized protein
MCADKIQKSQDLNSIEKVVRSKFNDLLGLYLYGSRAQGQSSKTSDWDLAILPLQSIDPMLCFEVSGELEEILGAKVDLVDLKNTTTVLQFQIISKGQLIWCSDNQACQQFEMLTYSKYQRFNLERRAILEEIGQRGSILS